jgi:hypothetical protein
MILVLLSGLEVKSLGQLACFSFRIRAKIGEDISKRTFECVSLSLRTDLGWSCCPPGSATECSILFCVGSESRTDSV